MVDSRTTKERASSPPAQSTRRSAAALALIAVVLVSTTFAVFTIRSTHPALSTAAWEAVTSPWARLRHRQTVERSYEGQLRIVDPEIVDKLADTPLRSLMNDAKTDNAFDFAVNLRESPVVKKKAAQKTGTGRPATSKLPARPASNKKSKQLNVQVVGNFIVNGEIDTQTPLPEFKPSSPDEKFITFAPHSGLTNQRSTFANAYTLAYLLNRTLLLPDVRLGRPIPWKEPSVLRAWLERDSKPALINQCARYFLAVEEGKVVRLPEACKHYNEYTQVSWSFLFDLDALATQPVRMLSRSDLRPDWFYAKDGLALDRKTVKHIQIDDPTRYHFRIMDDPAQTNLANYNARLDLADLRTGEMGEAKLIEFNSLYGSMRLGLSHPDAVDLHEKIGPALTVHIPYLESVAEEVETKLGGRGTFWGIHLRVGDSSFERFSKKNMDRVWMGLCKNGLKVEQAICRELREASRGEGKQRRSLLKRAAPVEITQSWEEMDSETDDAGTGLEGSIISEVTPLARGRKSRVSSEAFRCRGPLYTEHDRLALNKRFYIATDAQDPLNHAALAPFVRSLPCAFFIGDFASIPSVKELFAVRAKHEKVKLGRFFVPLLDATMAARGARVIGTPGSTFSGYVKNLLHQKYWPKHL